jgi:hypothetical protein
MPGHPVSRRVGNVQVMLNDHPFFQILILRDGRVETVLIEQAQVVLLPCDFGFKSSAFFLLKGLFLNVRLL